MCRLLPLTSEISCVARGTPYESYTRLEWSGVVCLAANVGALMATYAGVFRLNLVLLNLVEEFLCGAGNSV
jgi:hypothetical protein